MNYRKLLSAVATAVALYGAAGQASALTMLTLENPGTTQYQQTLNSPCVIGDPSCKNTLPYTLIPNSSAYDLISPYYTIEQIRGIVGDVFFVGIDVNTTTRPLATEQLDFFGVYVNGVLQFEYSPGTPTQLYTLSNGNGYSDALLKGFDLSAFAAGSDVAFRASIDNATDGREQFFLVSSTDPGNPPTEIPEPGTTAILGLGLLGLGMISLRGRKKQS